VKYVDGVAVVRPRPELDRARLFIKWEVLDVDRTQTVVDRRRLPDNETVMVDSHLRDQLHRKVTVSAIQVYVS